MNMFVISAAVAMLLRDFDFTCSLCILFRDHMLLRAFGPYVIVFMNVSVVIAIVMVMLLRDFGPHRITFMTMYV
jgi:hypothetical protein